MHLQQRSTSKCEYKKSFKCKSTFKINVYYTYPSERCQFTLLSTRNVCFYSFANSGHYNLIFEVMYKNKFVFNG